MARQNMGVLRFGVLIVALVLGMSDIRSIARADEGYYTNQSIEGWWGFSASGTIVPAPGVAIPAVAVGTIDFDGAGGCSFLDTINIGGSAFSDRLSTACAYAVTAHGTGTISAEFPGDELPTPLSFVIVDGGNEIRFIRTDAGVAAGVAKRQGGAGDSDDD